DTSGLLLSSIGGLTSVGDRLYFAANAPDFGRELWQLHGGVVSLVADLSPGATDSSPQDLTAFGDQLLFTTGWGTPGLMVYDGVQVQ
ncbi:hypothetical protein NL533_32650, partial [Klebsiella pneumoniae]|nr:hypothetical protein [Klebsiella pneumoniae]